jgi:hypothetical protein
LLSAAQVAVSEHVPVPLVMVTAVPVFEHAPLLVITAVVLALVVVATVKWLLYAALVGAPVNVTVGAIFVAAVDWFAVVPL